MLARNFHAMLFAVPRSRGPALRAQLELLYLSVWRSWKLRNDLDEAWHGEIRHPIDAIVDDLALRQRAAFGQLNGDHHFILAKLGWHGIGCRDGNARMRVENVLYIEGRNVLAAPPDHILDPIDEMKPAILLSDHPVARVEPHVSGGRQSLVRHAEIPCHERVWIGRA